jgi:hypothetical protein
MFYTSSPVLFLVFNRLDTTRKVFEAIRQAKPPRLYIACDGPRVERNSESEIVQAVRDYLMSQIDWDCEVRTLFREENLGCRVAVSSAIDWFFEHEEEGIILEDDCLPDPTFFSYVEELLERYREDIRVTAIAGTHFHGDAHKPPHSYFFSRYAHCWGWGSWRRAWQHYDRDMKEWKTLRNNGWLLRISDNSYDFMNSWTHVLDSAFEQKISTWDYQWLFACWIQNGLTILPAKNLVRNIGFTKEATHTQSDHPIMSNLTLEALSFPLVHPCSVERDKEADIWTEKNLFQTKKSNKLKTFIKSRFPPRFNDVYKWILRK